MCADSFFEYGGVTDQKIQIQTSKNMKISFHFCL